MAISAEARVIATFTFLTALLLGAWRDVTEIISGLLGAQPPGASGADVSSVIISLLVVAVAVAATLIARSATDAAEAAWARSLGQAAIMLGIVTSLAGLLRTATLFLQ